MKNALSLLIFLVLVPLFTFGQDEVILTIDGQPVNRSEFERIYHKNSNIEGYENKSPEEYLDMFINFKLKVLEAKRLGYDTLQSFVSELAGYRDQLSKPYLQDRTLIDNLLEEAYYRTVHEVNASHIMVKLSPNPTPEDTLEAYKKAVSIRDRVQNGEPFEKIARTESDDPSGRINSGKLGWFSAFTMVYPFENAAYNTKTGAFSMPVRSRYGYHIIKVNAIRPALGEIKLSHIMIRAAEGDDENVIKGKEEKIKACYSELQNGSSFTNMVKKYSEDAGTVRSNGTMRWLRSGELPPEIEDVVFKLNDTGTYTSPIRSDYGWHIFLLQGKRPIASFEELKPQLEEKIMMDDRGKMTTANFLNRIKKENDFRSYPENISAIAGQLDSAVYTGNWDVSMTQDLIEPVFAIGDKEFTQKDLAAFISKTKRYNKKESYEAILNKKFEELTNNELMNFEKKRLEDKHPAFRYLMEEYHDGILLFNIMDEKVWSKAVSDTVGLRNFYDQNTEKYFWGERADISLYTVKDPEMLKPVAKLAKKRIKTKIGADAFNRSICASDSVSCVEISDARFEKDDTLPLGGFTWTKGYTKKVNDGSTVKLLVVNEILPPSPKSFRETRGQVTADYQNYLDIQWIESLRAKYKVVINKDVLSLVK